MRAPDFWWQTPPTLIATALMPAGYVWGAICARRMQQGGVAADAPVICIGNFVAGGAGKTPTALACAAVLARNGMSIAFLTRGYGGTLSKSGRPVRVEPGRHSAIEVGDEPLLLARVAPAFVSSNRVAGANAATALGADVLVMDDGRIVADETPQGLVAGRGGPIAQGLVAVPKAQADRLAEMAR